ncbi:serine hydrolase domain-containing protein [Mammaliicoccus sp. O-M53]|uniref:serine hydrolase domain-containing protein n=1 Tax=Mammaliicoccus sp. O-M53 TaxID=2898712 RepID=UPI001EFBDF86|nr:serine hydrolase domain-containing protein [Mammaliicoccus sp. O-M53]
MKNLYKFSLCIIVGLIIILFINQFKDFNKKKDAFTHSHQSKNHKNIANSDMETFTEFKDINDYLTTSNFNGNITIYKDNKLVMSDAYGYRDFENSIKNDSKSMYLIGSANKFITGLMLRQLEEKGTININDNVNKYIPNFQNKYPISIKDLMLHRSGLAKINLNPNMHNLDGAIASIKSQGVLTAQYHQFNYNDANYITLAKIIEVATNKTFEENLNELILNKAHLKYTSRYDSVEHKKYMAKGYKSIHNQNIYVPPMNLDKYDGAGNIYISTDDMAKLVKKFKSDRILSHSSTVNLLSTGDLNLYPGTYRYGFYNFLNYQRYRGIFYKNDIITYSNDRYIVSIASNKLPEPYNQQTEKLLQHIYSKILKQQLKQKS